MQLRFVDVVEDICTEEFKKRYFNPKVPVVIKNMAMYWPAHTKWNSSMSSKLKGVWNLVGMRNIDTLMKKAVPQIGTVRNRKNLLSNWKKCLHDLK